MNKIKLNEAPFAGFRRDSSVPVNIHRTFCNFRPLAGIYTLIMGRIHLSQYLTLALIRQYMSLEVFTTVTLRSIVSWNLLALKMGYIPPKRP
jgi:hypothetical protein